MKTNHEKERALCGLMEDRDDGEQGAANLEFDYKNLQTE
jgi:hypothetical protein